MCSCVTRAVGLTTLDSWIEDFDGMPGLVIERYDRSPDAPQGRIHQEDMDQALGASKDEEYQESQESGGKLSLERVAELLGRNGDEESVHRLLRLLTLSQAGGNLDMHSKNISMLHLQDGSTRITSANDVIPQTHLDGNGKMALAINRKFLHAAITVDDLIEEAQSWKLRSPRTIVMETLDSVKRFVQSEAPVENAYDRLRVDISAFTRNLVKRRPTGHGV